MMDQRRDRPLRGKFSIEYAAATALLDRRPGWPASPTRRCGVRKLSGSSPWCGRNFSPAENGCSTASWRHGLSWPTVRYFRPGRSSRPDRQPGRRRRRQLQAKLAGYASRGYRLIRLSGPGKTLTRCSVSTADAARAAGKSSAASCTAVRLLRAFASPSWSPRAVFQQRDMMRSRSPVIRYASGYVVRQSCGGAACPLVTPCRNALSPRTPAG